MISKSYIVKSILRQSIGGSSKELENVSSLLDLDQKITAPLHGFDSLDEYYRTAVAVIIYPHQKTYTGYCC